MLIDPYRFGIVGTAGMDDEFPGTVLDPKWTPHNLNTSTITLSGGIATLQEGGGLGTAMSQFDQPITGGPGDGIWRCLAAGHADDPFNIVGMTIRSGSGIFIYGWHMNGSGRRLGAFAFGDDNTFGGTIFETADPDPDAFYYLEIECNPTDIIFRSSPDEVTWTDRFTVVRSTVPGFIPDKLGFGVVAFGGASPSIEVDWFHRIA